MEGSARADVIWLIVVEEPLSTEFWFDDCGGPTCIEIVGSAVADELPKEYADNDVVVDSDSVEIVDVGVSPLSSEMVVVLATEYRLSKRTSTYQHLIEN